MALHKSRSCNDVDISGAIICDCGFLCIQQSSGKEWPSQKLSTSSLLPDRLSWPVRAWRASLFAQGPCWSWTADAFCRGYRCWLTEPLHLPQSSSPLVFDSVFQISGISEGYLLRTLTYRLLAWWSCLQRVIVSDNCHRYSGTYTYVSYIDWHSFEHITMRRTQLSGNIFHTLHIEGLLCSCIWALLSRLLRLTWSKQLSVNTSVLEHELGYLFMFENSCF